MHIHLGLLELIVVRSVNEVSCADKLELAQLPTPQRPVSNSRGENIELTALLIEIVENRFSSLLVTDTHKACPRVAKVHGAQAERRNA